MNLTDVTGDTDYVEPKDTTVFDPDGDLQDSLDELGTLEKSLEKSVIAAEALDTYGARQDVLFLLSRTGLSSGVLSSSIEAFGSNEAYLCALEDVQAQADHTAKTWVGKAISLLGAFVKKIGLKLKELTDRVAHRVKESGTKLKTTVKAHPYATAAAVLAGLITTGGAISVARGALSANTLSTAAGVEQAGNRIAAAFSRIKFPFGKLDVLNKGGKIVETVKEIDPTAKVSAGSGGWTMSTLKLFSDGLSKGASSIYDALKSFGSTLINMLSSAWKTATPHLKKGAGQIDTHVAGAIQYGHDVAANHKNFIVRMGAGMLVFSFTKGLIGLVIKSINWVINGVTKFVKGTVNVICGPETDDEQYDEALAR